MGMSLGVDERVRRGPAAALRPSPYDEFVRKHGTIKRRGVFGNFVHNFGQRIVGGEFAPGATLPSEPELVAGFGISRTVVREAMKCLAGKGLVEIKTRVGTRVRERQCWHHLDIDVMVWHYETGPSADMLAAIRDIRRALEPEAAARAARRASGAEIEAIAAAYEAMAATIGDRDAHADADLDFHTAVFAATHNPVYAQMIELIAIGIYSNRTMAPPAESRQGQADSLPFHKAVLDAIAAHDTQAAVTASHRLLDFWRLGRDDL